MPQNEVGLRPPADLLYIRTELAAADMLESSVALKWQLVTQAPRTGMSVKHCCEQRAREVLKELVKHVFEID